MADTFFWAGFGSVQFQGSQSRILILDFMTEFDEAFIVAILHNGFDRWVQEAAIIASGGEVNSKTLEKNKWTDTGLAAKKYEGWIEEGIEFFNEQVEEIQNMHKTAISKAVEEQYLRKKSKEVDDKTKGPAKRSFHVSAKNGLVAVKEVVVPGNEEHTSVPSHLEFQTEQYKRPKSQLGNSRRVSKDGLENFVVAYWIVSIRRQR
jgi:hypothetical protein